MEELVIKLRIGSQSLDYVNTGIKLLQTAKSYYLPTDYKEPTLCRLIDYSANNSVNNEIMILATVDIGNKTIDVSPNLLFKTKSGAGDYYLDHKTELNWDFIQDAK